MASKETEKKSVTGLDQASDRKATEYNLVEALLSAAEYKNDDENITEAEVKRAGKYLFTVRLHPLSERDVRFARKKAAIMMANPNGKKLPQIEKEFDSAAFNSWLIYLATVEEDQQKVWGNPAILQKFALQLPVDSIDVLLTVGEKRKLADLVTEISGLDDDEEENVDEETFQS